MSDNELEFLKLIENLDRRVTKLELEVSELKKNTSLFHEAPRVADGWCQICGMEKAKCVHGQSL